MNQLELLERKSRLWHVEQAASAILKYTAGKSFAQFEADEVTYLACERQLIIIGEALKKASDIVHNYPNLDRGRIWRIIESDLPILLAEVRAVLATPDEPA
jgi:uncharacterized protein with HEPN domain